MFVSFRFASLSSFEHAAAYGLCSVVILTNSSGLAFQNLHCGFRGISLLTLFLRRCVQASNKLLLYWTRLTGNEWTAAALSPGLTWNWRRQHKSKMSTAFLWIKDSFDNNMLLLILPQCSPFGVFSWLLACSFCDICAYFDNDDTRRCGLVPFSNILRKVKISGIFLLMRSV